MRGRRWKHIPRWYDEALCEPLIGICQNLHGEKFWFPADSQEDGCPEPECYCEPQFYVPASSEAALREALERIEVVSELKREYDIAHAALYPDREAER